MKIFFSVGEPSGDLHGANLIRQLRRRCPNVQAVGYGGPKMAAAGCELHEDLTQLAVVGFARVFANVHKFWNLASRADRYLRHHRPDAVVLIDYPGFNWWIARRAKAHRIPVFYYGAPQLWGWAPWRVKKMRRLVDHVLCKLPFEEPWFRERGVNATYVGHPYYDQLAAQTLDEQFVAELRAHTKPLVTILPGSRTQEVIYNLPWFLKAVAQVQRQVPEVEFAVAAFNHRHAALARQLVARSGQKMDVHVGRTQELIHLSRCTMACSGSVSLELLYHARPTVILYHVSRISFFLQKIFRQVKYVTLVNLLNADELYPRDRSLYDPTAPGNEKVLFPEYVTCVDKSDWIASHVIQWLTDEARYNHCVAQLQELRDRVVQTGASSRGAEYILDHLSRRPVIVPRPHYQPAPAFAAQPHQKAA